MLPVLLHIGPLSLFSYGLMLALAFALCLVLARRAAPASGIDPELVSEIGLVCLIAGIAGARLAYVLVHLDYYAGRPVEIFELWKGGLIVYGGLLLATMSSVTALYRQGQPIMPFADFLIVYVPLGQAIGRIGCFLNGCCYGCPAHAPWAVTFPEASLAASRYGYPHHIHPVQLYEVAMLVAAFFVLGRMYASRRYVGQVLSAYLILYGVLRFTSEFFRGDAGWAFAGLSFAQLVSLGIFVCGGVAMGLVLRLKRPVR